MADALSAVAAKASPRALAKPSWLASRKPFAETFEAKALQKISASSLDALRRFMFAGLSVQPLNGLRRSAWVMRLGQQVTCRLASCQQISGRTGCAGL
jgi:hypothetical protein